MKKIMKWIGASLLILIVIVLFLLHFYGPTVGAQLGMPIYLFPPSPERYGKIAIDIMDSKGYYADNEKWDVQKEKALKEIKTISEYEEAYPIIEKALKVAGGKHSFLLTTVSEKKESLKDEMPVVEKIDNIIIIKLPSIMDAKKNGKEYSQIVLEFLQNNKDAKGVILDLQGNTGGDMGPMVTSVSPLLPDGNILFFSNSKNELPIRLENGLVSGGGTEIVTDIVPFKLEIPVAILTNEMTGSSAEALLMSFMDLDRVKIFGKETAGYASANMSYFLFDGTTMFLTTAFNKTPKGEIFYENPIPADSETERPLEEAMIWLKGY